MNEALSAQAASVGRHFPEASSALIPYFSAIAELDRKLSPKYGKPYGTDINGTLRKSPNGHQPPYLLSSHSPYLARRLSFTVLSF